MCIRDRKEGRMLPRCHSSLCQAPPPELHSALASLQTRIILLTSWCHTNEQDGFWRPLERWEEVGRGTRWVSAAGDGQNWIVAPQSHGVHAGGLSLGLPAVSSSDGCIPPGLTVIWLGLELSACSPRGDALRPGPPGLPSAPFVATSQGTPLENQSLCYGAG